MVQLALWLAGCAAPVPSPASPGPPGATPVTTGETGTDTADTASTEGTADTAVLLPPLYAGDCDVDLAGASPLELRVLFDDNIDERPVLPNERPVVLVFTDAGAYADWISSLQLPLDPAAADFATEIVVAGVFYDRDTCGISLRPPLAWDVGGVPHAQLEVWSGGLGCGVQWFIVGTVLQVVALPRGASSATTACMGAGGDCLAPPF
jgi:hypothetical protein